MRGQSFSVKAGAPFSLARPVLFCAHYFYSGYSVVDIINKLNRTIATQPLLTCALFFFQALVRLDRTFWVVILLHVRCSMFVSSSTQPRFHSGLLELLLFCLGTIPPVCKQSLVDKTLTPSPWTTPMDYPCGLRRWTLVIRVRKLGESTNLVSGQFSRMEHDSRSF